jgi:hypothetical protein
VKDEIGPIVILKAYIDDTGKGEEPYFILAGFVAPAEKWDTFSHEWDAKLKEPPVLAYFKMREAASLHGQFYGWSDENRDRRVSNLIEIINRHVVCFAFTEIERNSWDSVMANKVAKTLDSPFYHAYCTVISIVLWRLYQHGPYGPVDFIFDKENETIFREVLDWWVSTKRATLTTPRWIRRRMRSDPRMGDDLRVLPLQAADLFAWLAASRHAPEPQKQFGLTFARKLTVPGSWDTWDRNRITQDILAFMEKGNRGPFAYEGGKVRSARLNQLFGPRG